MCNLKFTNPQNMSVMSNSNYLNNDAYVAGINNGEGLLSGRFNPLNGRMKPVVILLLGKEA